MSITKVQKELSPDEKTLLNNCMTMMQEIIQMNNGGEAVENAEVKPEEELAKANSEDATGTEVDDKKKKSTDSIVENGGNASGSAEETIENVLPDATLSGTTEAQKNLMATLKQMMAVKSAPIDQNLVIQKGMIDQLAILTKQNQSLERTLSNVLEGIGISEKSFEGLELAKRKEAKVITKSAGTPEETLSALSGIVDMILAKKSEKVESNIVAKSETKTLLRGLMTK